VYLAEVGCKRSAAANVETVFSGAGKFMDEAGSAGHTILRHMVKLLQLQVQLYRFIRPTVDEVCARYKVTIMARGSRGSPRWEHVSYHVSATHSLTSYHVSYHVSSTVPLARDDQNYQFCVRRVAW
jgi:hypothetical protein